MWQFIFTYKGLIKLSQFNKDKIGVLRVKPTGKRGNVHHRVIGNDVLSHRLEHHCGGVRCSTVTGFVLTLPNHVVALAVLVIVVVFFCFLHRRLPPQLSLSSSFLFVYLDPLQHIAASQWPVPVLRQFFGI